MKIVKSTTLFVLFSIALAGCTKNETPASVAVESQAVSAVQQTQEPDFKSMTDEEKKKIIRNDAHRTRSYEELQKAYK